MQKHEKFPKYPLKNGPGPSEKIILENFKFHIRNLRKISYHIGLYPNEFRQKVFFFNHPTTAPHTKKVAETITSRPLSETPTKNLFNVGFFNARSIRNKTEFLFELAKKTSPSYDLIFIVESWLDDRTLDAQVCPKGYNIIRKDRKSDTATRGGGVLILHKTYIQLIDKTKNTSDLEHLCVDVCTSKKSHNTSSQRFVCYYSPPGQSKDNIFRLCQSIRNYLQRSPVYIVGDFNLPNINWLTNTSSSNSEEQFLDLCLDLNLTQHVKEPTHLSGSTLDLILTNPTADNLMIKSEISAPFTSSCDHNFISFQTSMTITKPEFDGKTFYCYRKGNYVAINNALSSISWDRLFNDCNYDVQTVYDNFLSIIHSLMNRYIPKQSPSVRVKHNRKLRILARKKAKLYQRLKVDKSLKSSYKNLSLEYDNAVRDFYDKIESNVCNSSNNSAFYNYASKTFQFRRSIPAIVSDDGELLTENSKKAEHFNKTFQSVFTQDNAIPMNLHPKTQAVFNNIHISSDKITMALHNIAPKTSATPDGIPPLVLKKIGFTILDFLTKFFQLSLSSGCLPKQWKTANIIPIHKKSSKDKAGNYRPISMTSSICRLLESIIKNDVLQYLMSNNMISDQQQGFLPKRGTVTQLLKTLNDWTLSHDQKQPLNVIYTDFAKAFDRVSHKKLSETLSSYGLGGNILNWINEFLTGRTQRVEIEGVLSSPLAVISGVPQGSVLGPLLFIIFIDDIRHCCIENCKIGLYADDSKIYSQHPKALQDSLVS